jgi:hypothetical protein
MAIEVDSVVVAESEKWQSAKGKEPAKKQAEKSETAVVAAEDMKGQGCQSTPSHGFRAGKIWHQFCERCGIQERSSV